jgi:hypothetical protein
LAQYTHPASPIAFFGGMSPPVIEMVWFGYISHILGGGLGASFRTAAVHQKYFLSARDEQ